jgi:hypothetical protein
MTFPHPMDDKTGFEATDEEMGLAMSTKHTPGPWKHVRDSWIVADSAVVCVFQSVTEPADARLIAAAPDMLAALKEAEPFLRRFGTSDEATAVANVCAAIAKATGEA